MKRYLKFAYLMIAVAALLLPVTASANSSMDFGTGDAGSGGTITVSGATITGSAIPLDVLNVNGTLYDLNGTATGSGAEAGGNASLDFSTTTGAFTITGSVWNSTDTVQLVSQQVLLNGTLGPGSASLVFCGGTLCEISFSPASDTKSADLLAAVGLPGTQWQFGGFTLGVSGGGSPYTAISTDIVNSQVPEPATLTVLGIGLLALGSGLRRKLVK